MTPDVRRALERTRALLLEKRWDPTSCARDADGKRIEAVWPAASYSLCGALTHATEGDAKLNCRLTVEVLGSGDHGLTRPQQLTHWENAPGRTLDEVLALIDLALAEPEPVQVVSTPQTTPPLALLPGGAPVAAAPVPAEATAQKGLFE